ncbi:MAG: nitronate monooxygenase family protein [Pyramidobacter sp.]|nr:nitronate monooxygenase family protein [Pyramidobacter sp.]
MKGREFMVLEKLPVLKIGKYQPRFPIIQGGMGVMISGPNLCGAVAAAGGVGTLATVGLGMAAASCGVANVMQKNIEALKEFIARARAHAKGGVIAANCMCALTDYEKQIRAVCEAGVDIIISGAGLPLKLPELTKDFPDIALVPIVSSLKAADIIVRRWTRHFNRIPDAFVVETPNAAGGHLGASSEEQAMDKKLSLETVIPELVAWLKEKKLNIPVIAAGGIFDRKDMLHAFELGASGVQMGTRFAATVEGDASDGFKQAYVNAKEEDVVLLQSPCGLPGRAIKSPMLERYFSAVQKKLDPCIANCLSHCVYRNTHKTFCIAKALISAFQGNWENGLFFCGSNVGRVKKIQRVKEIFDELMGTAEPENSKA